MFKNRFLPLRVLFSRQTVKNFFDHKVIGATLLLVGTSLGGGILALPVASASVGFALSSAYLVLVWFIMTYCALLILEINLLFPVGTNFLTMSKEIFGRAGEIITGFCYLFLLYTLLCAYIAGGSDMLLSISKSLGFSLPNKIGYVLFTVILGSIVFTRMSKLDLVNRVLIVIKLILYIFIVSFVAGHINVFNLTEVTSVFSSSLFMVLCASFGFAVIIPSLRIYLGDQPQKLRLVVICGSLIPLVIYLIWNLIIMGVLKPQVLIQLMDSEQSTSLVIQNIELLVQSKHVKTFFYMFSTICIITSFLGISLSLSDFLTDGLGFKQKKEHKLFLFGLTFLPPLLVVLLFIKGFVVAISYAGIFCVLLHIVLPLLMIKAIQKSKHFASLGKTVNMSNIMFILLMIFTIVIMIGEIKELWF